MKLNCIKLKCSECCSRYWITLLPAEAKRIAKRLGLSEKEFTEKKCILIVHLYSKKGAGNGPTINSEFLPSRIADFVEQSCGTVSLHFLILPSMALKRNSKGECIFLKKARCEIHTVSPAICKLFPFMAMGKEPLKEVYPFCIVLQQEGFERAKGKVDEKQKARINKYFDAVERRGFHNQWRGLPGKGIVLLEGERELVVSKKEFLQLIQPFL